MKAIQLRVSEELKSWIKRQARINGSSQNSEVIRAIRERKERHDAQYRDSKN